MLGGSNIYDGVVTLDATSTIGADANTTLTINNAIGGFGDLNKAGVGTLSITGAAVAAAFTGATNILAGILVAGNATALGQVTGTVTVTSGTTLQINGQTINGKPLVVNGSGFGNAGGQTGALAQGGVIATGNSTWTGNITLANSASVGSASGFTFTINGIVSTSDASGLTKVGIGIVLLNASNTFLGNVAAFGGTLALANTNAYAGTTTFNSLAINGGFTAGNLTFVGIGSALNTTSFTVNQNSIVLFDNSNTTNIGGVQGTLFNSPNRIAATVPITLNTATLQFNAVSIAGLASAETFGPLTLASGQSIVSSGYTTLFSPLASAAVTFASLTRNPGATVNFTSAAGAAAPAAGVISNVLAVTNVVNPLITTTAAPLLSVGQIVTISGVAGATGVNGTWIVSAIAGNTFNIIAPAPGVFTAGGMVVPGVALGGPAAASSFNRILFTNSAGLTGALQGNGGGVVPFAEVQGGANGYDLASYNQGPTVNLGVTAYTGYNVNPASPNAGDIVLVNTNTSFATTSIGALLVNTAAATVAVTPSGSLTLSAGALLTAGNNTATLVAAGTLNLASEGIVFQNATGGTAIDTAISGAGDLVAGGGVNGGSLTLGGTNPYTGGTLLNAGTLVAGQFNLGISTITLNGGSFDPANSLANPVNLNGFINYWPTQPRSTAMPPLPRTPRSLSTTTTSIFDGVLGESGGSHSITVLGGGSTLPF